MTCKTTVRPRGFTLIELLVVIAIIGILIGMLQTSVRRLHDSASAASQFPDLQAVASDVMSLTEIESPVFDAIGAVGDLVSMVQQTQQPPDPQFVAEVLQELQTAEAGLGQDLAALDNPASAHVAGELEAYLHLKNDLQEVVDELHEAEIQVKKLTDVATPGP